MIKETKSFPWTVSDGVLVVTIGKGATVTIDETHPNFARALSCLRSKEWDLVPALIDIAGEITRLGAGLICVKGEEVFYQGQPIVNSLTARIVKMLSEGVKNLTPMVNFLENCMLNPNRDAPDRLFTFLEKGRMPLTPDGCFLAYRGVNENFTDRHTGTFDNSPGQIVKMDRKDCDEDSNSCCSRGLHFCSLPYLGPTGNWGGGSANLIIIKINPRDVCAIPFTYEDTKGRCCRFEVLRVWQGADQIQDLSHDAWETSLVAETEEVTSPAVRAMLNLARIEEALEGFDMKPVGTGLTVTPKVWGEDGLPLEEDSDGEADFYGDDYDPDSDDPDSDDPDSDDPENCDLDGLEGDHTPVLQILPSCAEVDGNDIFLHTGKMVKGDTRKILIQNLYDMAVAGEEPAYCFANTRNHKTQGDLKVTPKGSVLVFDADSDRWAAWYNL